MNGVETEAAASEYETSFVLLSYLANYQQQVNGLSARTRGEEQGSRAYIRPPLKEEEGGASGALRPSVVRKEEDAENHTAGWMESSKPLLF